MAKGGAKISGAKLVQERDRLMLTQVGLAQLTGLSPATIQRIEGAKETTTTRGTLWKLATAMKVDASALTPDPPPALERVDLKLEAVPLHRPALDPGLMERLAGLAHPSLMPEQLVMREMVEPPMLDLAVAAGGFVDVPGHAPIPLFIAERGIFRITVRGDSMRPVYPDGARVEFRTVGSDDLHPGKDYCIELDDGTATFKRLERVEADALVFRAINRRRHPRPITIALPRIRRVSVAEWILGKAGG